jgi:cutinase
MKPTHALIALATIVYAAPIVEQTKALTPPLAELDTHFEHQIKRCGKDEPPFLGRFPFANETYNQLTDGTPCRNVTMIYARGSRQAGNVGKANNTGPALFNSLADRIGLENLAVQGVTYKARRRDFIFKGGCNEGSKTMAKLINQVRQNTKTHL